MKTDLLDITPNIPKPNLYSEEFSKKTYGSRYVPYYKKFMFVPIVVPEASSKDICRDEVLIDIQHDVNRLSIQLEHLIRELRAIRSVKHTKKSRKKNSSRSFLSNLKNK